MKLLKIYRIYFFALFSILLLQRCEKILEEPVHSQFASSNLLSNKQGLESVLVDAYGRNNHFARTRNLVVREEMSSDILWQTGGGENGFAKPFIDFRWEGMGFDWMPYWEIIRDANIILENIENAEGFNSEEDRNQLFAETKFMRVWAYYQLWNQFGPMPIRTSQNDPLELSRATSEEFYAFVESQLLEAIPGLPLPGNELAYGRVHKGGAQALLCKWYLNNHKWQKCAGVADDIIDAGDFELVEDYTEMFALGNEQNKEFMLVQTKLANAQVQVNTLLPTTLPWGFKKGLDGGIDGVVNEKWANYASQYRLLDDFYYSFDSNDKRRERILTLYLNNAGDTVNLLTDYQDATRAMKYPPDPNATGGGHGNDFPMIRYADILLSKAEALNELNGPKTESIDLINQIRNRAGLNDIQLADYSSKESLTEQILKERRWEFWYEGKRRRDLIRTGKFIEYAHDRGITNATENHVWFPLPQGAIDANPNLEQNPGF